VSVDFHSVAGVRKEKKIVQAPYISGKSLDFKKKKTSSFFFPPKRLLCLSRGRLYLRLILFFSNRQGKKKEKVYFYFEVMVLKTSSASLSLSFIDRSTTNKSTGEKANQPRIVLQMDAAASAEGDESSR